MRFRAGLVGVAILVCVVSADGAPRPKRPIDGTWKVVFFGYKHAHVKESDKSDPLKVDAEMTLIIKDDTLTIKSVDGPFTWKIDRLSVREAEVGEIDLSVEGEKGRQDGIIKVEKEVLYLRLPVMVDRDRPKEFTIKGSEDGILIAAKRLKD